MPSRKRPAARTVPSLKVARRNRILAALKPDTLKPMLPELEPIHGETKHILNVIDRPIDHVYFVLSGVASMVAISDEGRVVEVATVGNEGMVGLTVFHGVDTAALHTLMQVPGELLRLPAERFQERAAKDPDLPRILNRYTQALITQIAQSAACNRLHSAEERCARWLLMTHDRTDHKPFKLTHEFLSQMLGVRRATVTEIAGALQNDRLITYKGGVVRVLDRDRLEEKSCECYGIITREYDRLLGRPVAVTRKQSQAGKGRYRRSGLAAD